MLVIAERLLQCSVCEKHITGTSYKLLCKNHVGCEFCSEKKCKKCWRIHLWILENLTPTNRETIMISTTCGFAWFYLIIHWALKKLFSWTNLEFDIVPAILYQQFIMNMVSKESPYQAVALWVQGYYGISHIRRLDDFVISVFLMTLCMELRVDAKVLLTLAALVKSTWSSPTIWDLNPCSFIPTFMMYMMTLVFITYHVVVDYPFMYPLILGYGFRQTRDPFSDTFTTYFMRAMIIFWMVQLIHLSPISLYTKVLS